MKNRVLFVFIIFLCVISSFSQSINIVPKPKTVELARGLPFEFNYKTKIVATDEIGRKSAGVLNDLLMKNYGFKLEYTEKPRQQNAIIFISKGYPVTAFPPEGYGLGIEQKGILIYGSEIGQFYALQTLMQILPVTFKGKAKIPAVNISDKPRFKYRGLHLDVSRHFMPLDFVKKFIDLMSQYKLNTFHWHLTDDQGWRIEIKKYPKLTEIGSKRKESQQGSYTTTFRGDGIPIEGFYTQDQIREVVKYAKMRHITVIPEIELPGHASAALAAYPEFGCNENLEYKVQQTWGVFKEVFCPTDKTFKFLEDVLEETIALFPNSPYIHIGGDEVLKDYWKESAFVQDLKKRENLKDEHEVQSYFVRRIEKFINSKGKIMIGWDEILEGGLAPNAVVMSWRGEKGGIEAAKSKHDVIMTPTNTMYFDYGQGDPKYEPLNIGNQLSLETVYAYNPIPKELTNDEAKYILGAQANIWTEYLKKPEQVEYMAYPRVLALSELVWTPLENKNFADFSSRLPSQFARLDRQNVNYRIPEPIGLKNMILGANETAKIELSSIIEGAKILYSLDGNEPKIVYQKPLEISLKSNETVEIKTVVVTPNNRKSVIYTGTITNRPMQTAVELTEKNAGVKVKFYTGQFDSAKDLVRFQPTETFDSKSIQLPQFANKTDNFKQPFGAIFEGYISVPADGIYEFQIEADDGATLEIGGEKVIDADGTNGKQVTIYGIAPLQKGLHKVILRYLQVGENAVLNMRWGVKGGGLRRIYGSELFR